MARKAYYLYEEDLEVFVDMIENGNFDGEEFTSECGKRINTVRFLSTSLIKRNSEAEQGSLLKRI